MKHIILLTILLLVYSCRDEISDDLQGFKDLKKTEKAEIRFLGHWLDEGKREQLLKEQINEFEFTNQDVSVHTEYLEKMSAKIGEDFSIYNAENIRSETPEWDIIKINNMFWRLDALITEPGWKKKYLVDFSEIPEFRNNTRPELLTDKVKASFGGIIPGPFIDGYNWPMWCNTEVAKKVGITIRQFDMTFDDFKNYIKAVYDYNQQNHDSIVPLFESSDFATTHSIAEQLFFSELGNYDEIMDNSYSPKKVKIWEKVLRDMESLSKYNPLPRNWDKMIWLKTNNYPIEDKCLFFVNGSWMYNIWLQRDSAKMSDIMPAELPVYKSSPVCFGGYNVTWVVPKKAKNRDKAVRFLLSMNKPDVAEKWIKYTKSPTGVNAKLTNLEFGLDKFENFQYTIDRKYKNKMGLLFNSAFCLGEKNANILNYSVNVLSGSMTADQATREIRKQLKIN